jgi:esterase
MNGRSSPCQDRTAQRWYRDRNEARGGSPHDWFRLRDPLGDPHPDAFAAAVDSTDMRELAHTRTGGGPRALVLLHGFLGSSRNLATLVRELSGRDTSLTLVVLDLTGHGASPPLPAGADTATLARDVFETAGRLGLPRPLRLVGHSLGGRAALRACLLDPAAVAHVTLLDIGPSSLRDQGETARVVEALVGAPEAGANRDIFRDYFRKAGMSRDLTEWLLLNLIRDGGSYRWRIDRAALAALHPRIRAENLWPAVDGPRPYSLHCIRGGLSDYVSDDDARRLRAAGCPVDTVEEAGHFLHVERPAEVAERVLAAMSA